MVCTATLINPKNNKVIKTQSVSRDTYKDCETYVQLLNSKIKDGKYWTITTIN